MLQGMEGQNRGLRSRPSLSLRFFASESVINVEKVKEKGGLEMLFALVMLKSLLTSAYIHWMWLRPIMVCKCVVPLSTGCISEAACT